MAQLALGIVGGVIGTFVAPGIGTSIGFALGSMAGALLFAPHPTNTSPAHVDNIINNGSYGQPIPYALGHVVIGAANRIWQKKYHVVTTSQSVGKGFGGQTTQTQTVFGSCAWGVCLGPIAKFGRIWANGKVIVNADGTGKFHKYFTYYYGTETQLPDPTIEADQGAGKVPGYRGLAYIVATEMPLGSFGNSYPDLEVEVITNSQGALTYDGNFLANSTAFQGATFSTSSPDQFGNIYPRAEDSENLGAISPAGTRLFNWGGTELFNVVAALAPGLVNMFGSSFTIGAIAPVLNGQYLVVLGANWQFSPGGYTYVIVCSPSATGAPTPLGFVRIRDGNGTANFTRQVDLAGAKTADDPILLWGGGFGGGIAGPIEVCPSVNEIIHGTYAAGWGGLVAYQVPYVRLDPVGGSSLQTNLYSEVHGSLPQAQDLNGGWCLPNAGAPFSPTLPGTDFYCYFNRAYMDSQAGGSFDNVEIHTVLQPAYPHGCMVRTNLGVLSFAGFATAVGDQNARATDAYAVVNSDVVDESAAVQVPFTDEYTYLTTNAAGGHDTYSMQPALVKSNGDGTFLVLLTMAGISDETTNHANTLQLCRVRAFSFNPLTAKLTQFGETDGVLFTNADLGLPSSGPVIDPWQIAWVDSSNNLKIWGSTGPFGQVYLAQFGNVNLDGDIGLDECVDKISVRAGLTNGADYDVTALAVQRVRGVVYARQVQARQAITILQGGFFFIGVLEDDIIRWKFRGGAAIATISEDDLGARSGNQEQIKVTEVRRDDVDLPRQIVVLYTDPDIFYEQGAQPSQRLADAMFSQDTMTLDNTGIVFSATEAVQVAERALYLQWNGRTDLNFFLPMRWRKYSPGDVLTLVYGNGTISRDVEFTETSFGADLVIDCKAIQADAVSYIAGPRTADTATLPDQTAAGEAPTTLTMVDGPLLSAGDDQMGYYGAMRGPDLSWPGAIVYKAADATNYAAAGSSGTPAVTGTTTTVLASNRTWAWDRTSTVNVLLDEADESLASVTEFDVLNRKNHFLIGSELIGAATVTLLAPGVYQLSDLTRGLQGTDWAIGTHAIGERVIVIQDDASVVSMNAPLAEFGTARQFKGVTQGDVLASATEVDFTPAAIRIKPISPVVDSTKATRDGSNNLTVPFTPRSRLLAGWYTGTVDESQAIFRADVIFPTSPTTVARTITSTASANGSVIDPVNFTVTYKAADQTLDGITPGNPVEMQIYQMSARIGALAGYSTDATV